MSDEEERDEIFRLVYLREKGRLNCYLTPAVGHRGGTILLSTLPLSIADAHPEIREEWIAIMNRAVELFACSKLGVDVRAEDRAP